MAPSSSAKKVARLASRGKGKKVRFSGGTTFPVVVASVSVAMVALIAYSKWTMPSESSGPPQAGDQWTMAYEFRVCDTTFTLEGSPADLDEEDASAGDRNELAQGANNSAGFLNYHPQVGGATGGKARLGVFLDVYDVTVDDDKIVLPESQVGEGERREWDIDADDVFAGTSCEGEDAAVKVRVWPDASTNRFEDKITDFDNLRFTNNGMALSIAIVPADGDFEIAKPPTYAQLEDFGVIGAGDAGDAPADTTPADTTPADTAAPDTTG